MTYSAINKLLIVTLISLASFTACQKDDTRAFTESADSRINATLTKYQKQLSGAQNGWKAFVYPAGGGIYSFYFKFNDSNRVKMVSGFDSASSVNMRESSYRLKALQQPSLLFDTYSYLHVLADPTGDVNGGPYGEGLVSDFEFYFDSASTDTIRLVGRFNKSKAVLIRASAQEEQGFNSGQLASGFLVDKLTTYFKRLTFGANSYDVRFNTKSRTIALVDANGNLTDTSRSSSYYATLGGIALSKPISVGSTTISSFSNLNYSTTTNTISLSVNNTENGSLAEVFTPLKVDAAAPKRWWDYSVTNNSYWVNISGFHVNGVSDAYRFSSVPGYNGFMIFWARYGTSGGVNYDLLSPIFNNATSFGAAYRPPTFTAGKVVFAQLGVLGTANIPAAASANFTALRTKVADTQGYYFVQLDKDGLLYDMVSARDGKAWITWEW